MYSTLQSVDGQKKNDRVKVEDAMYRDEDKNLKELTPFGSIPVIEMNSNVSEIWFDPSYDPQYNGSQYMDYDKNNGVYRLPSGVYCITITGSSLTQIKVVYNRGDYNKLIGLYFKNHSLPSSVSYTAQWSYFVINRSIEEKTISCEEDDIILMILMYGFLS